MFCNKVDSSRRLGHYPLPESVEVKILAGNLAVPKDEVGLVGEICLRGRNVMSGYINNHASNREAFVDCSELVILGSSLKVDTCS
jgi:acyl-CoA synthetase (AMP-forming)/AMP-acid ligase II